MHSYLMTHVQLDDAAPIYIGTALKTSKGDKTSEALQLEELMFMSSRTNYRKQKHMTHTEYERELRKKISKEGAKAGFKNELVAHIH